MSETSQPHDQLALGLQNEVDEKVQQFRTNDAVDAKAKTLVRAVVDLKNSIDQGSMKVVLKDPVGDLGSAMLSDAEKTQYRGNLLAILNDMNPAKLSAETQRFQRDLASLQTHVNARITAAAGEVIHEAFHAEKLADTPDVALRLSEFTKQRELIVAQGDVMQMAQKLHVLEEQFCGEFKVGIEKLNAYYEGRDTTPDVKAAALQQKMLMLDAISTVEVFSLDGFAPGQKILLDGQQLEGKFVGDVEVKSTMVDAPEVRGNGGVIRSGPAPDLLSSHYEVSVLAIDPVKGIQLSAQLYRERGITRAKMEPTWYRPEALHALQSRGWMKVADASGKGVDFATDRHADEAKDLQIKSQVEMEKSTLLSANYTMLFPGMNEEGVVRTLQAALPSYSGIDVVLGHQREIAFTFATFDQLSPIQQLPILGEFKQKIFVAQCEQRRAQESDPLKQEYLSAQLAEAKGGSMDALATYANFLKTKVTVRDMQGRVVDGFDPEYDAMRKNALEKVQVAKLFRVNELLQLRGFLPASIKAGLEVFSEDVKRSGSLDEALKNIQNDDVRALLQEAIAAVDGGPQQVHASDEAMGDLFMKMKAPDAAQYFYQRAFGSEFSSVRRQMEQEGKASERPVLNEKDVLKSINSEIDQWLKSNNVVLNYDQLQSLRGEMFTRFMAEKGVDDLDVHKRMVQMSDLKMLNSTAWDKYREHFDPAGELFNLSDKTRQFVFKQLPIIALEIGILIAAPHVAGLVAPQLAAAIAGLGVSQATAMAVAQGTAGFVTYEVLQRGGLPFVAQALGDKEKAADLRHITIGGLALDFALIKGAAYIDHRLFHGMNHKAAHTALALEADALMSLGSRAFRASLGAAERVTSHNTLPHSIRHFVLEKAEHGVLHDLQHTASAVFDGTPSRGGYG